jgi:hypothetical protein
LQYTSRQHIISSIPSFIHTGVDINSNIAACTFDVHQHDGIHITYSQQLSTPPECDTSQPKETGYA